MEFEWDEDKSRQNEADPSRALPFEAAIPMFDKPCLVVEDTRRDYGEARMQAVGVTGDLIVRCIYTDRTRADGTIVRRIISLHTASRRQRHAYRDTFGE